ncbi:helicase-associated domain-containing protein [Arthrobacter alpinus]|nr:helicase-associated domain-containing protein [Arthrobacter alpinus]
MASTLANLGALATDPLVADAAAPDIRTLMEAINWLHPRQTAALGHEIQALLQEMEWLGITGAGAVSVPGRAAVNNRPEVATATLRALLPAPVENFVLQGDLTAIAPGFLAPELTSTLKLMAVPEGRGAAGIFRFSQHSLEAAASGGMSRSFLLNFLQERSSTAVPQSLEFLIAEVFRNRPDGDVSAESEPRISCVQALAPSPSAAQRWAAQPPVPGTGVVHDESDALAQLKRLRSQPVWANDGVGESGPALVMEELRQALEHGRILRVRAVNRDGEIEELLLLPVSLDAGMLRARLAATGRERRLSIHRIISALAKPQDPEPLSPAPQPTEADHASPSSGSTTTSRERHD